MSHAVTKMLKNFMVIVMSDAEGVEVAIKARFEFKRLESRTTATLVHWGSSKFVIFAAPLYLSTHLFFIFSIHRLLPSRLIGKPSKQPLEDILRKLTAEPWRIPSNISGFNIIPVLTPSVGLAHPPLRTQETATACLPMSQNHLNGK